MLTVLNHPLITHKLSIMRDVNTSTKDFAQNMDEIAGLMAYEVSRDLPTKPKEVRTPMGVCRTAELAEDVILIPILRAGVGMTQGIRNLIPTAKVGFVGLYRDQNTLKPVEYYSKLPKELPEANVLVLDPMLATGGSASATLRMIKEKGARNIKLVCLVGAPEGVRKVEEDHPDVDIYLAALDEKLDENGYIFPGLGDAGDRIFGTK